MVLIFFHFILLLSLRCGFFTPQNVLLFLCRICHLVLFLTTGCRVKRLNSPPEVSETENLLILSNHQSAFDISSIILSFPNRRIYFVAKKELAYWYPSISQFLRKYNGIIIDRSKGRLAVEQIKQSILIHNIKTLALFPEGTRSRSGNLNEFKCTGTIVSLETFKSAEVIPVVFTKNYRFGNPRFFPFFQTSKMYFLPKKRFEIGQMKPDEFVRQVFEEIIHKFDSIKSLPSQDKII
ncbi:MAG: 1-acyl-sn-glycerol-3-phosphate acyltransferase [Deltaproteobacteria bacterium]|nr:1-acyl-sn-glycerol-3-phosphate acyltransferase [Deltaproteobacteria bacterium]